jgi:hydroxysqualene dehydroxylase
MENRHLRIAVIGAGWAGAAAALTLARAGAHVSVCVFEAAKIAGGRARRVDKDGREFDNGQHLLLGAYARSAALIASVHGAAVSSVIERLPLALSTVPNALKPLRLATPNVYAPLHLLLGLLGASGLTLVEKLRTITWSSQHLLGVFSGGTDEGMTVSQLIAEQPARVRELLWEPLCVAALNTPAERATASVFIEVLRRAFLGDTRASDMLIPRTDLSNLFPEPALIEVVERGGEVRSGSAVIAIHDDPAAPHCVVQTRDEMLHFDRIVIATGPQHIARLLEGVPAAANLSTSLSSLNYEPISTLHYEFSGGIDPESAPMLMLDGAPGQWLFAHRLSNGRVRASVVISAHNRNESEEKLLLDGLVQLRKSYALPAPTWQQVITEKRATYSCTPVQTALLKKLPHSFGRLYFAGDWCVPELPATLESAVIAGEHAAAAILKLSR